MIYFITGREEKFREAKRIVPTMEHLSVDLDEIQSNNPKTVIEAKIAEASRLHPDKEIVVEDTSLYLDALDGFPGPLVKWFIEAVKLDGIYRLAAALGNPQATVRTVIGYKPLGGGDPLFFEGSISGTIVTPQGAGFGFDPIFQPDGFAIPFGEMDEDEKTMFSMRTEAFQKLQRYLERAKSQ